MKTKVLFAAILGFALIISSCGKYEDGPGFSLRSKTARLTGIWTVTEMTFMGQTFTADDLEGSVKYEFLKDGTINAIGSDTTYTGTWEWGDKKESIEVTMDGEVTESTITRLTNKELWWTETDEGYLFEIKAEKK